MMTCRSCSAPIQWARTTTGKRMPIDAAPVDNGTVLIAIVGGEAVATVLSGEALRQERVHGTPLYVSHFATCPNAAVHRVRA